MADVKTQALPDVLDELLRAAGPSNHEFRAAEVWRTHASKLGNISTDQMGSSVVSLDGTVNGTPSMAVVGHIDEIGLIVRHIDKFGMLHVDQVGGWDPQQLVGQRVRILSRKLMSGDGNPKDDVIGIIGKKPIHLIELEERKKASQLKDLRIDIGAKDRDEALEVVRIGDVAVIDAEPIHLRGSLYTSRAFDNRIGSWVSYEVARLVAEAGGAPGEVQGWAVAQEETGLNGAGTTAHRMQPDIAIVVDVTHASDQVGVIVNETGEHPLGSGPVIETGTPLHPWVSAKLIETAEAAGIPYTLDASGRRTGTDADQVYITGDGVSCGLVSVPLRYMHSSVETAHVDDIVNTAKLIAAFALQLGPDSNLKR